MIEKDVQAVVLAAGRAKRFKTPTSKLVHTLCGQEMVLFVTKALEQLNITTTVIVGHQKESVMDTIKNHHQDFISFVTQEKQEGTGHAVACSKDTWTKDLILIMNGDMPLVNAAIIKEIYETHTRNNTTITLAVAYDVDPAGAYGRIVQKDGTLSIVEAKEFTGDIKDCPYINAGIYLVERDFLESVINTLARSAVSNEFYITDIIKMASDTHKTVTTVVVPFDRVRGINTFKELADAEHIIRTDIIHTLMLNGVRFYMPQTNHIDLSVTVGVGTQIEPGVQLHGTTSIGANCTIHSNTYLNNARLDDGVTVLPHSVISDSHIHTHASVGPFAHILGNSVVHEHSAVGNFVEVKRSTIGAHTKAKHLSYIGNTTIGTQANIGAGTITCNYDGANKHETTIADHAFVGSNNTLVAPVTIGEGAYTAAGSVITEDVPADALAIARSRQTNKEGYAHTLRARAESKKRSE